MAVILHIVLWLGLATLLVAGGLGAIGWWQLSKTQPGETE
jgi:hypothetical protein